MINIKYLRWLSSRLKQTIAISFALLLSACGGGLGGSGDGGSADKLGATTLPSYFDSPYEFQDVPEIFMADFPSSLAASGSLNNSESAYRVLTDTVSELIDKKLEIALLTLLIEVNWNAISEHCSTTADDTGCDLSTRSFVTTYTSSMAAWEYLLREKIELERSGRDEVYGASLRIIESIVNSKIGTELTIDSGYLTRLSSGSHRYEITTTADLGIGFGETIYVARWSEDQLLTYVSIVDISTDDVNSLQSSYVARNGTTSFNNSILATTSENDSDIHSERQLNLNQVTDLDTLEIEAQQTDIKNSVREDYYSIGYASTTGGYLKSEQVSEDETDTSLSTFFRETFNGYAAQESNAICRMSQSEEQCDFENRWEVRTPQDPILSQFFLTTEQLSALESELKPFNVQFEDISDSVDVLVLLPRENLKISVTANGIILQLPGLGTIDLTTNAITPEEPNQTIGSTNEVFEQYTPTILCRANRAVIDDVSSFRTYCAGSVEDIEDALVIGESFTEGKLVIEWQANADIRVIDQ